jgi:tetratricopeptide (TPR) repeat protein
MSEPGAPQDLWCPRESGQVPARPIHPARPAHPATVADATGEAAPAATPEIKELEAGKHLDADRLRHFMTAELPPGEMRHVLRHLLRGCGICQELAREVWNLPGGQISFSAILQPAILQDAQAAEPGPAPSPVAPASAAADDAGYEAALDRVFSRISREEAAVEAARQRADDLYAELVQHPPAHQELLVQNSARFRDRMVCEKLLGASHEEGFREPARSLQLASLALRVAERLAEGGTDVDLLAGLRARAWAQVGNASRIGGDLYGAATAFQAADGLLAANPRVGLIDKAQVLSLKAVLCRERRQFAEAGRLFDRAIAIYRRLGQTNQMGRAVAQKALVLQQASDPKGCLALLHRALELVDPHDDPRTYLSVRHNLIVALVDDDRPREAFALLFHTRPLYLKIGDRMILLRLRWLEGQVAQALHRLEQAEAAFREVRQAFVELGIAYEVAQVSLDLAAVYAAQGRTAEMRRLAEEMLVFFESHQVHREAMAALALFCNAASRESAGVALVQEVVTFLKQARNTPDLRFSPRAPA